jgi:energy-coupling factor transport system permease protein
VIVEYESKQTSIHNLDPRAKFIWLIATIVISIIWTNPVYLAALGLVTVVIGCMGEFPWAKMKGTFLFLLVITAIITLVQGATYVPKAANLAYPERVLFHLVPGWIPGVNPAAPIRIGGFLYGVGMALKVFVVLIVISVFGYVTSPSEVVQIIVRIPFFSYKSGFVVSAASKFVPVIQMQMATLRDAERSKGVDFDSGSFTQKVSKTTSMLIPLFANALSMADTMALAMESRAFGYSENFTLIRPYHMHWPDWLMAVLSIGALAASIVLLCVYKMGAL